MPKTSNDADSLPLGGDVAAYEVADYAADLSRELARMARAQKLTLLAYILEMAVQEARAQMRTIGAPPDR